MSDESAAHKTGEPVLCAAGNTTKHRRRDFTVGLRGTISHAHEVKRFFSFGAQPQAPFVFWFFCGEAAKKPEHKHFSGVYNPQSPALQSGKPLSFMRMGCEGLYPLALPWVKPI
jgi:hypothetical protein